jgi:hypothetical protein
MFKEQNTLSNPNLLILTQNKSSLNLKTVESGEQLYTNFRPRRDRIGTQISKGNKKHLVTFNDQLGSRLIDRVEIESYKTFNVLQKTPVDSCSCVVCNIF